MNIPKHLQIELDVANESIRLAEQSYNDVQTSIALWRCTQGEHVFALYTKPPIVRACLYCRVPEENKSNSSQGGNRG